MYLVLLVWRNCTSVVVVALENMNQLVATSAILGMMAVYLIIGIWWVSRKL